ncbi:MAG: ABC transporter permease subunit [Lachnospiraceae bacterium]|nr:ABC transporter permease subunit [Lachnospiraceae bacterium]
MKINPILKKELTIGSRSIKMPVAIFFYDALLALCSFVILLIVRAQAFDGGNLNLKSLAYVFPILMCTQAVILYIMIPIITASSVSGERERQTLDIMLTTPVKPVQIITGKLATAIIQVFLFVFSSLPMISLAFLFGGINWVNIIYMLGIFLVISIFAGSIGIYCSSVFKKTLPAIIVSMVIELFFVFGTLIAYGVSAGFYEYYVYQNNIEDQTTSLVLPWLMVANPAALVADYLYRVFNSEGIFHSTASLLFAYSSHNLSGMEKTLINGLNYWMIPNILVLLGVSMIFIKMAANRINPLRRKGKKRG